MFAAIILLALVPLSLADPEVDQLNRKCCTDYVFCLCELIPTGRSITEVEELNREDAVEDVRGIRLTRGAEAEEHNREDVARVVRASDPKATQGFRSSCEPDPSHILYR